MFFSVYLHNWLHIFSKIGISAERFFNVKNDRIEKLFIEGTLTVRENKIKYYLFCIFVIVYDINY